METIPAVSPLRMARIAGVFYLLTFLIGVATLLLMRLKLVVYGDAANLVANICYVVVTVLFYRLFKPVNPRLSFVAACFSLVGCAVAILGVFHLVPIPVNNLVFFGCYCLLIGLLIVESTFLPRTLGVLMMIAGCSWLTFVSPSLAHHLSPYNLLPGIIAELSLTLWLIIKGIDAPRWQHQATRV